MLLLWLLLVPSARATIDCNSACGLCAMDTNSLTAACSLCRECHRVHRRMMGPNNQKLSNRQDQKLKDLERKEFRQVMKEYGWVPEDLADSNSKLDNVTERNCLPPPSNCINDQEYSKLAYSPTTYPTLPATQDCPPAQPSKKKLNKRKTTQKKPSFPSTPSTVTIMILKQMVTLQYEAIDQGSPTQTTCPDESDEYEEPLYQESVTEPSTVTTCRPEKLKVLKRKLTSASPPSLCVPCMPLCPLPCGVQIQNSPMLPSIPPEALAALMTLKPTTINEKQTMSTQSVEKRIEEKIQKMVQTQTSKVYNEDTTKDYVYLYVGIPKYERHA